MKKIPIDFVAGTHGNFLEVILNRGFGFSEDSHDPFTELGTSHNKTNHYHSNKIFHADHWSERTSGALVSADKIVSIRFDQEDLLMVTSVSLARAGDLAIHNNDLEIDTYNKLNNDYYRATLDEILKAYPSVNATPESPSIPRNILREYYKFGFKNPDINGYWKKLQQLVYLPDQQVFYVEFKNFYNANAFFQTLRDLEQFVGKSFNFDRPLEDLYEKFLSMNNYKDHQVQCDQILQAVQQEVDISIPKLTLFQESYINARLENMFNKEMPFHDSKYFTSIKDVLYYINNQAPNL